MENILSPLRLSVKTIKSFGYNRKLRLFLEKFRL